MAAIEERPDAAVGPLAVGEHLVCGSSEAGAQRNAWTACSMILMFEQWCMAARAAH